VAISALVDSACGLFFSYLGEFREKVSRNAGTPYSAAYINL
jgi:hypothetical protein